MRVNFVHDLREIYDLKVDSDRQILEKIFMAILFAHRVFARNLPRGCREVFIFRFVGPDLRFGL